MDDLTKQDALELEVANFGPIVEAKIDLRPLTVFVGPSNTGKSYLAILIYALHRFFSGSVGFGTFWNAMPRELPQKTIDAIDKWAKQALPSWETLQAEGSFVLPPPVTDEIRSLLDAQGDLLGHEIIRCFGMDETSALVRKGNKKGARVVFRRHVSNGSAPFEHELVVGTQGSKLKTTIPAETPIRIHVGEDAKINYLHRMAVDSSAKAGRSHKERHSFISELIYILSDPALAQLAGPLHVPASYLPADRTGVMHAHRVLISSLLNRASHRQGDPLPDLSGVVADFLNQLIELGDLAGRRHNKTDALAKRIEQAILTGSVQIKTSAMGYPLFFYKPAGWKDSLPLMNTSSMVSELAPVVLYLRHVVQPGETLIIEEPEAHLHPAMQVEFIRQIAALVQAGVRVIVTTHSEWVLEELGNIVRCSELPETRRKKIPQGDFALRPDQVGAWLFKPKLRPRGSVVKEIKLDAETGLYPTDYDDVSLALYNDSVGIFNRIQSSKAE